MSAPLLNPFRRRLRSTIVPRRLFARRFRGLRLVLAEAFIRAKAEVGTYLTLGDRERDIAREGHLARLRRKGHSGNG